MLTPLINIYLKDKNYLTESELINLIYYLESQLETDSFSYLQEQNQSIIPEAPLFPENVIKDSFKTSNI